MNKEKRTRRFGIRLSEKEYERLQNYMERTGLNTSDLFRTFIRDNPIKEIPGKDVTYLLAELKRVKGSLDYLAESTRALDKNCNEEIAELRAAYRGLAKYIKDITKMQ